MTVADGEGMVGVIVGKPNSGELSSLVVIVCAFVLIERELTVATLEHVERYRVGWFLVSPFNLRADGDYRTFGNKHRDGFKGRIGSYYLIAT